MMPATALLLLTLAAPTGDAAKDEDPVVAARSRAEALVIDALAAVETRIATLTDLRRRMDEGETIGLSALRSIDRTAGLDEESLAREMERIRRLRDEIRVAEAALRTPKREPPATEEDETGDGSPETPGSETPPEPAADGTEIPGVVGETAIRLADSRYLAENYAGALVLYEKASETSTWARLRQGRCLERLGRVEEAREVYASLESEHPEDRWAESARWSLKVLDLDRDDAEEER